MDNNDIVTSLESASETLKELKKTLTETENSRQFAIDRLEKFRGMVEKAGNILKTAITNGEVDGEDDFIVELCDALDVELTQEVEITVTATWSGTATIPIGKDISDYEDYFEVSIDTCDSDLAFDCGYSPDSVEVQEA